MRYCLILTLVACASTSQAQKVIPFVDFNNYFRSFQQGFFRQVEFQEVRDYKAGDDLVAYVDNRSNLVVYNGDKKENLSNVQSVYEVSDNLMTWQIGPTLNLWEDGDKKTLTYNSGSYWVRDSIVVYEDERYRSLMAYYGGKTYELSISATDIASPISVGDNIVAFKDNGNVYKIFWRGEIYEFETWHNPIDMKAGVDIVVFNDPIAGTFTIFENGEFLDVEEFKMQEYAAGRGFIAYVNLNNDLVVYQDGETEILTNFGASYWEVKDDVIVWTENMRTYAYVDGTKTEIAQVPLEDIEIKNATVVFKNAIGGVDAFVDGKIKNLTAQLDAEFEIYGNSVLVELFNRSFIVYKEDRIYRP